MAVRIIFSGGGTAGHINPALAIAKRLKSMYPDAEILFVGTQRGLESKLVPHAGFKLKTIPVRGFVRKVSTENFKVLGELFSGLKQAGKIIDEFCPDLVVGTGGYVCGPVLLRAALKGIPTLIHEQNAFPGITNKLLSRFVSGVAASFPEAKKYFKSAKKIWVTGNPVREEILQTDKKAARQKLGVGVKDNIPMVLVSGGSGGAQKLNEAVVGMLAEYYKPGDFKLLFSTGQSRFDKVMGDVRQNKPEILENDDIKITPYIFEMADAMGAADVMVTRGGAIAIAELSIIGTPSIIIPSPNVTENHQEYNARALQNAGGADVLLEADLNPERLYHAILDMVSDREKLRSMGEKAKMAGNREALTTICNIAAELMEKKMKA